MPLQVRQHRGSHKPEFTLLVDAKRKRGHAPVFELFFVFLVFLRVRFILRLT